MAPSQDTDADPSTGPDANLSSAASMQYWNSISSDVNGILGGYPQISRIDLRGSLAFATKLRRLSSSGHDGNAATPRLARGVDCGAGIGRVTEGFLTNVCQV